MTSKIKTKRERVKFASDNVAGACPEVLDAIIKANEGDSTPYGNDEWSTNLQNKFSEIFEKDVIVYPTASGTAANALALSAMTPVFGSIYCHKHSHINTDECGAPEFYTGGAGTAQGTRRLLIQQQGAMYIDSNFQIGSDGNNDGLKMYGGTSAGIIYSFRSASSPGSVFRWYTGGVLVGSVSTTTSSTSFNTSSDYRLKENVNYDFDATSRLKQLKPARFNFIADGSDNTVDGFLAHEVSNVVPQAVSGDKDATRTANNVVKNADGTLHVENVTEAEWTQGKSDGLYASDTTWASSMTTPVRQMIDHSKLVPLLTKTIQELEARITAVESSNGINKSIFK